MKVLLVSSASRVFLDENDTIYLNHHITNKGFQQFKKFDDVNLTILLRYMGKIEKADADGKYEKFEEESGHLIYYPNVYSISGYFDINKRIQVRKIIKEAVYQCDKVICGTCSGIVANTVSYYCRKFGKPYLVQCLGYTFEGQWYHSIKGKIVSFKSEIDAKKNIRRAPYVLYVTQDACQKRYPTKGIGLGCSDVEIQKVSDNILKKRIEKISKYEDGKIVVGTAASVDVKWKGQHIAIKAIKHLIDLGYNIEYQLIGMGNPEHLIKLATKLGIQDSIKILGSKPHDEVAEWLDNIDVYVQPSFQEGLCRSIVEAMSRACPVVCTNAGGNYELIDSKYIATKGSDKSLYEKLKLMLNKDELECAAKENFENSKNYDNEILTRKRMDFYRIFLNS